MKNEIICQGNIPPHLYPLPRIRKLCCNGGGQTQPPGRDGEGEGDFALTSSPKFSITLYIF
jgi:hypothetical protein